MTTERFPSAITTWFHTGYFHRRDPDFSYRGAKGTIALTGYDGILGYRTDICYKTRENLQPDQQKFLDDNPDFDEAAWKGPGGRQEGSRGHDGGRMGFRQPYLGAYERRGAGSGSDPV